MNEGFVKHFFSLRAGQYNFAIAKFSQILNHFYLIPSDGLSAVNNHNDKVGLMNGRDCLLEYVMSYAQLLCFPTERSHLNSRRVDYFDQPLHDVVLLSIPGHARMLVHYRQPLPNHAVEK